MTDPKKKFNDYDVELLSGFLIKSRWITVGLFAFTIFIWTLYILLHTGKRNLNHLPFFLMVVFLVSIIIIQSFYRIIRKNNEEKRGTVTF